VALEDLLHGHHPGKVDRQRLGQGFDTASVGEEQRWLRVVLERRHAVRGAPTGLRHHIAHDLVAEEVLGHEDQIVARPLGAVLDEAERQGELAANLSHHLGQRRHDGKLPRVT